MHLNSAVIWDLDGTLVDSAEDLADSLNFLLRERGQREHPLDDVRNMIGDGVAALVERGFAGAGKSESPPDMAALVSRFMDIYLARVTNKTCLYPGALHALKALSEEGVAQGLCTNKPFSASMAIIEKLGIGDYFGAVIGGDSTPQKKPDAGPVLACIDQLSADRSSAVFVGDSPVDLAAGRAAGLPVILMTYGYSRVPVASLGADALATRLEDIPALIADLA